MPTQEDFLKGFSWDGEQAREELLIRAMLYGNPLLVLRLFEEQELKRTFLNNIHRFQRQNRSFWKLILEVSEDELKEYTERNFREGGLFIPY